MGYVYYHNPKDSSDAIVKIDKITNPDLFETFNQAFSKITYKEDGNEVSVCGLEKFQLKSPFEKRSPAADCEITNKKDLLEFLNSLQLSASIPQEKAAPQPIIIEYQAGRKDRVLVRMYEDGYVTDQEYKEALIQGIHFVFQSPRENIKDPHFVFYVKDYIVGLYGEEFFEQGGWKIYTTLDPKLQTEAETIIESYAKTTFANYGINNGALVTLDNKTGDVVAMVGSQDYYNKDIDGEVNIITSLKQPGSSMKPLSTLVHLKRITSVRILQFLMLK
jgi:hypothetical protein